MSITWSAYAQKVAVTVFLTPNIDRSFRSVAVSMHYDKSTYLSAIEMNRSAFFSCGTDKTRTDKWVEISVEEIKFRSWSLNFSEAWIYTGSYDCHFATQAVVASTAIINFIRNNPALFAYRIAYVDELVWQKLLELNSLPIDDYEHVTNLVNII